MRAVILIGVGILTAILPGQALAYLQGPSPPPLSKLIRLLKHRHTIWNSSTWAPDTIGQRGYAAREARPALLAALNEEGRDAYFRAACVRAIALTGPSETVVLEALRKACREDQDFSVRAYAAAGLVRLDPEVGQEYLQILVDGIGHQDGESKLTAIQALALLGSPNNLAAKTLIPLLVKQLEDSNFHVRASATTALARLAPAAPETIAALASALQDPDESVHWCAARDCQELGVAAASVVPQLAKLLSDRSEGNRYAAATALAAIGAGAQSAVPQLIDVLPDPRVREAAINALAKIGPPAVTPLIAKLHSESAEDRSHACRALAVIGPAAGRALPEVLSLADDEDASVRQAVPSALGVLGDRDDSEVRAALSAALSDPDRNVRLFAAASFIRLGRVPTEAIRVLRVASNDVHSNWFTTWSILSSMKAEDLPAAIPLLKDDDPRFREQAFRLVAQLGQGDPERSGAAVLQELTDAAGKVQWVAVAALQSLVAKHSGLFDEVVARQRHENREVRTGIAHVLGAVDNADGEPAAKALVALLADPLTRRGAYASLVELGSRSDTALEVLLAAVGDADLCSRSHILSALGRINGPPDQGRWTTEFRFNPAQASDKIGKAAERIVPAICQALDDPTLCAAACELLVAIRPTMAQGALIGTLHSEHAKSREATASALGDLGPEARSAIPALITALADNEPDVQIAAARGLLRVGVGSELAAAALAKTIANGPDNSDPFDPDPAHFLEYLALNHELAEVPIDEILAAHLLPLVLRKLESQEEDAADNAQTVLIDLGIKSPRVVPALQELARTASAKTRERAKEAVAAIEAERASQRDGETEALAWLREARAKDCDRIVENLLEMHPAPGDVLPALLAMLNEKREDNEENAEVRAAHITALAAIGGPTKEVMTAISPLLQHSKPIVRRAAAESLGSIGSKASDFTPALAIAAQDSDSQVQCAAVTALGQVGPNAKAAMAPLWTELFADPDDRLVRRAAVAMAYIDPAAGEEAVPILLEQFPRYLSARDVRTTIDALGRLGAVARPALPELISYWQRTVNYQLPEALANAIRAIDPDAARAAGVN